MGWCFLSQKPINHSDDLKRLRAEGYNIEIKAGFLLVKEVPYLNSKKEVKRGILVDKLKLAGDVAEPPEDHVAHFMGEYPCHQDGKPIEQIGNSSQQRPLAEGVTIDHTFSAKPQPAGKYTDHHAKVAAYCSILGGPARTVEPSATARTHSPVTPEDEDKSIFNYIDTASSRAEIGIATQKLALEKVAIIGLGGTGSYVLDLVAKTPIREIHLFDNDVLLTHNAFRAPGAPSLEELRGKPRKVNYFAAIYSKMHRGIIAHATHIDADNIDLLRGMKFVFLCFDDGMAKRYVIDKLHEFDIPFVDVGMGIYMGEESLGGHLRVTTSTPRKRDHVPARIPLSEGAGENEYSSNIQIADLNALNAALAVGRWKKLFGFYADYNNEHHVTYGIELQSLTRAEEQP